MQARKTGAVTDDSDGGEALEDSRDATRGEASRKLRHEVENERKERKESRRSRSLSRRRSFERSRSRKESRRRSRSTDTHHHRSRSRSRARSPSSRQHMSRWSPRSRSRSQRPSGYQSRRHDSRGHSPRRHIRSRSGDVPRKGTASEKRLGELIAEAVRKEVGEISEQFKEAVEKMEQKFEHHKQHMYSVTNAVEVGREVLQGATLKPVNTMLVLQRKPVPGAVLEAIKGWNAATCEDHIQAMAYKAMVLIAPERYYVLDTHLSKYYKCPIAKIGVAMSTTATAIWSTLVAPIELKFALLTNDGEEEALGQMTDLWNKVHWNQSARQSMMGIIMGKDCIELLRFSCDSRKIERSGLQEFEWAEGNIGWQVLHSFLNSDLGTLGYKELATPAAFRVDGKQVSQFTLLANPHSGRPVFKVMYGQEVAVLKLSGQASQEREVEILQGCKGRTGFPSLVASGSLPDDSSGAFSGATHFYIMTPAGEHAGKDTDWRVLCNVMNDVLAAILALNETGIVHRDIAPQNIVLAGDRGVLLDYNVATSINGQSDVSSNTGRLPYRSLALHFDSVLPHNESTEVESLLYSLIDIVSDGSGIIWSRCMSAKEMGNCKLAAMTSPDWEGTVLKSCKEESHTLLRAWHDIIFQPCAPGWWSHRPHTATVSAFLGTLEACMSM